ncbi:MAG: MmgE/PrpD family protein [Bradymonadales bacterium]|nr:MmgE/PrpD family protein [Bradymonadales bacterium]
MTEHSKLLATFCAELSYDKLPVEVTRKAKLCLLDYLANIYGSLELQAARNVLAYIRSLGGSGRATVHGTDLVTDLHHAAFANGTLAEAIEAQDGLRFGGNHPGTAVIPAALAVGEDLHSSGREVITAIVTGYEAACRPAMAVHPAHTMAGFLPTGTCGTFGAAVASGCLKRFSPETMLNALGNAGYLVPLSMAEQLMGGYTIKIVQGGQAASAGLMAAAMAEHGLTGAPYVLEGSSLKGGFTQITMRGRPMMEKLSEGLGEQYPILEVYFKPYTTCRHTHGAAQAILELKASASLDPSEVERVTVLTYTIATVAVGKQVVLNDSFVNAQFSLPYVVAVCLTDGALGPLQLTEERLGDAALIELAGRVEVIGDKELGALYPGMTASAVEVHLKDGQVLTRRVNVPKGDPRDPMEEEALAEKVRFFAGQRDTARVEQLIQTVLSLDQVPDIHQVIALI